MIRLLDLFSFHFKLFCKNSYFISVVILSTTTLFVFQYLAAYSQQEPLHQTAWLRAGIFGLWASGTTAAGVIGMQKWQGTLMYLLNNPLSDYISMITLVMPAATFGLLSFVVSYLCTLFFQVNVTLSMVDIGYILLLWLGATVLDFCIASLFVLTSDAIIYEELISLPVLLLSGMFQLPHSLTFLQDYAQWLFPIAMPIRWLLFGDSMTIIGLVKYVFSVILALGVSYVVTKGLIKKSKELGRLGGLS